MLQVVDAGQEMVSGDILMVDNHRVMHGRGLSQAASQERC